MCTICRCRARASVDLVSTIIESTKGATDEVPVAGLLGRRAHERPDRARRHGEGGGHGGGAVPVGRRAPGEGDLADRGPAGAAASRSAGPGTRREAERDRWGVRRDQGG